MTRPFSCFAVLLFAAASIGCGESTSTATTYATWLTEPAYEFGDDPEGGVLLSQVPYLRVAAGGERVFVVDLVDAPLSVWTLEGSVAFAARRGQGPGEFARPTRVYQQGDGGFVVREGTGSRFTHYTEDATLVQAAAAPIGSVSYEQFRLRLEAPTEDGGYLALPQIPLQFATGTVGVPAVEQAPILAVKPAADGARPRVEPIFWLDEGNLFMAVPMGDEFANGFVYGGQPFTAADQARFEVGRAVVMRTDAASGEVEFIEINAAGDTVWNGLLRLEPMRVTDQMVEAAWDDEPRSPMIPEAAHRRAWEAELYRPDHVPAASSFFLAASGDVWVRTREASDTLRVYYAVPRDPDSEDAPRRVLIPSWLRVHDATPTHVWGIRRDALGVPRVVGRRLVPSG